MSNNVSIPLVRAATINDAPIIALLGRMTFGETFGHLFPIQEELDAYYERTFSVSKIRASLNKSSNQFWIATINELPVGYAKLKLDSPSPFIKSETVCQLQKIYVLKEFLGLKIGKELQTIVFKRARELKYHFTWLSVLHTNKRAIQFYKKNDFDTLGQHNFQIGSQQFTFYAMAKSLQQ